MNKEYRALYEAVSAKFNIGSYEDFETRMQTPEDRKKFYEAVSAKGFSLGEYDAYESRLKKKEDSQEVSQFPSLDTESAVPSQETEPVRTVKQDVPEINKPKPSFLEWLANRPAAPTVGGDIADTRVLMEKRPSLVEVLKENPEYGNKMVNRSVAAAKIGIIMSEAEAGLRSIDFEEVAELQKIIDYNQPKEGDFFYNDNEGFVGFMYDLARTLPESFISMGAAAETPITVGSVAAGAITGTAVPGLGTVTGAGAGFAFSTSAINEYGTTIMSLLDEAGVDIRDKDAIEAAFADKDVINEIKMRAGKRAGIIGLLDAISGGVSGKIAKKTFGEVGSEVIEEIAGKSADDVVREATRLTRRATATEALETAIESSFGGAGEALGSLAAGQEVSVRDVLLETFADPTSKVISTGGRKAQSLITGIEQDPISSQFSPEQRLMLKFAKQDPERFSAVINAVGYANKGEIKQINAKIAALRESSPAGKDKAIDKLIGDLQRRKAELQLNAFQELAGATTAEVAELGDMISEINELNAKYASGELTGEAQAAVKAAIEEKLAAFNDKYESLTKAGAEAEQTTTASEEGTPEFDYTTFSEEDQAEIARLQDELRKAADEKDTKKQADVSQQIIDIENKYRDTEKEAGAPGGEQAGQAPIQEQPIQEGGVETPETSGVVQEDESPREIEVSEGATVRSGEQVTAKNPIDGSDIQGTIIIEGDQDNPRIAVETETEIVELGTVEDINVSEIKPFTTAIAETETLTANDDGTFTYNKDGNPTVAKGSTLSVDTDKGLNAISVFSGGQFVPLTEDADREQGLRVQMLDKNGNTVQLYGQDAIDATYNIMLSLNATQAEQLNKLLDNERTIAAIQAAEEAARKDSEPTQEAAGPVVGAAIKRNDPNYVSSVVSQLQEEDVENLKEELSGTFGILTAENPNKTQLSEEENAAANKKALAWLKGKGYSPRRLAGRYNRLAENSFFVPNLSLSHAIEFANEFGQDSVAHSEGLVYADGRMNPRVKSDDSFDFADFQSESDLVSTVNTASGPKTFSVGYDFSRKVRPGKSLLKEKDISESKFGTNFKSLVDNFQQIITKLGGKKVELYVVDGNTYESVTGAKSRGTYTNIDGNITIVINADKASLGTVYHEMMHAYISSMKLSPRQIVDLVNTIKSELKKGNATERKLAVKLENFQKEYIKREVYGKDKTLDSPEIAEEFAAEFMAEIKDNVSIDKMSVSTIDKIRLAVANFINKVFKVNIDTSAIESRQEAFDFMNGFLDALEGRFGDFSIRNTANPHQAQRSMLQIEVPSGSKLFNSPLKEATDLARQYMASKGLEYREGTPFNTLDEARAKRISDAYIAMKDEPNNPTVAAAYKAMAEETIDQYEVILNAGYKIELSDREYDNSDQMITDLRENKNMRVFSTEEGFGDDPITDKQRRENPLLQETKYKDVNGRPLLVNDVFRFVHDFFGHAKRGNSFGPKGEENAWDVHSRMYTPLARRAMTSETRGQNSYVNFSGVNKEAFKVRDRARELRKEGRFAEAKELSNQVYGMMKFADQKVGLLPDEFVENPYDNAPSLVPQEEQGESGEVGTINIPKQQIEVIDAPKASEDPRDFVRDFVSDIDIKELSGRKFVTNMYDYTNAGLTQLGRGLSINLLGGRNYVPLMLKLNGKKLGELSNLAAFNTKAQAEGFIRNVQEGKADLFAPHAGTLTDSWQFQHHIFEELVRLVLENKIMSKAKLIETFNEAIKSKEGAKAFDAFNDKNKSRLKNLNSFKSDPMKLVKLLNADNNYSPNLRKALNQKIAASKDFQQAIGIKNLNQFYNLIADPLNEGVSGGEVMTFVEFDPKTLEVVKTKPGAANHHPSFGWVVMAKIKRVLQPNKYYKSYDLTKEYTKYNVSGPEVSTKEDPKFAVSNVTSSAGAIPKVAKVDVPKEQIDFADKPLYHGSKKRFNKFDMSKAGATDEGFLGRAVYLTAEYENAEEYGPIVNTFYADIKNPLIIEDPYLFGGVNPKKIREILNLPKEASVAMVTQELKRRGYDAVVVNEIEGTSAVEVAVLDPSIISDRPKTVNTARQQLDDADIPDRTHKKNIFQKLASGFIYTEMQKQARILFEAKESQVTMSVRAGRKLARSIGKVANTFELIQMAADYMEGRNRTKIAQELDRTDRGRKLLELLVQADAMVEGYANEIVEDPAFANLSMELKMAISMNAGSYLKTRYRFYTDKSYKITDKARRAAIKSEFDLITARTIATAKKAGLTEDQINTLLEDEYENIRQKAVDSIDSYINNIEEGRAMTSQKGADIKIPSSSFQFKKDLPQHIQELLGKEKNPLTRFTATIEAQANILYKGQMVAGLLTAAKSDLGDFILDDEPPVSKAKLFKKVNDPYSLLNGKYVHNEILEIFDRAPLYESDKAWLQGYFSLLKQARKSKVIWNIPTWRKNLTGGWYFMMANGVLFNKNAVSDIKNRLALTIGSDKFTADEFTEQLMEIMGKNGLIGTNINSQLVGINDAAYQFMLDGDEGALRSRTAKILNSISNADKWLQEKYSAVDDYTKLIIFRQEIESFAGKLYGKKYSELNAGQKDAVHADAAEFVKQNTPTFSRLPKFYDKVAVIPIFGDFASFQLESVRSFTANLRNAVKDMKTAMDGVDDNGNKLSPAQKKAYMSSAQKKFAGVALVTALRTATVIGAQEIFLDDDDEEIADDAKMVTPEWMKGQTLIVRSIDKDGNVRVYNYSSEDPYGTIGDITNGKNALESVFETFVRPNIAADYLFRMSKGEDVYGRKIFDKSDSNMQALAKFLGYTSKTFVTPPFISSSYRDVLKQNELTAKEFLTSPKAVGDLAKTITERSIIRDYKYNIIDQYKYSLIDLGKSKPISEAGSPERRMALLDEVREQLNAIERIAASKDNPKLRKDAIDYTKRYLKKEDWMYVFTGKKPE